LRICWIRLRNLWSQSENPIQKKLKHRSLRLPVIVAKTILIQIVLKVFRGDGMASTINTTFNETPKALNGVRVNDTTSVDFGIMLNPFMSISELTNKVVTSEFIGKDFGVDVRRGLLPQDRQESASLDVRYYLAHYLPVLTLYNAHDRGFLLKATTLAIGLPAYVGFIHFKSAGHLAVFFIHELANHGEHPPGGLVSNPDFTLKLLGTYPAACAGHQEHGMKPISKRSAGLMEYRASERTYLITAELAGVNRLAFYPVMRSYFLALLAINTIRITTFENTFKASIVSRIVFIEIFESIFCGFHFSLQSQVFNRSIAENVRDVKGYSPKIILI
jgi:hypothetical protein